MVVEEAAVIAVAELYPCDALTSWRLVTIFSLKFRRRWERRVTPHHEVVNRSNRCRSHKSQSRIFFLSR